DAARRGHSGGTDPCGPCPGGTRSRWPYPRGDRAVGPRGAVSRALRRFGPAPPNLGRTLRADARHKATGIAPAAKTYAAVRTASPNAAELGWTVFANHRRKGYATETARALMNWAATEHGISRFVSSTTPSNAPSLRVHDKLGFVRTGQIVDGEIIFELRR